MRWSATKLRWVLLAGVFVLAAVIAGFFGVARYRAGKIWQRILARNGINVQGDTNGFTWSQSSGGRTVFTLHASKATPEGNNRWKLHDAVLVLYGREPGRDDRIYGKEFEYDQTAGVARALGEVDMDLQTPQPSGGKDRSVGGPPPPAPGFGPQNEAAPGAADRAANAGVIHVRTSGLVYMRKLGIAATGEMAEFRYGGVTCVSRGAEFDSGPSVVRLLAQVRVTGTLRDASFTLTATHAELDRAASTAALTEAQWRAGDRDARAAQTVLHLRKDGSLDAAEAAGGVQMRAGTRTLAAPQVTAAFGAEDRPERARWFRGVTFTDTDRSRPAQGASATLNLVWAPGGELRAATAEGAVRLAGRGTGQDGATENRQLRAEQVASTFAPGMGKTPQLQRVHLTGNAEVQTWIEGTGAGGAKAKTAVSGDEVTTDFRMGDAKKPEVRQLQATGHTHLEQIAMDGTRQQSSGDALQVNFAESGAGQGGPAHVVSAVQSGQVEVRSWAAPKGAPGGAAGDLTTGHAAKAIYAEAGRTLTLVGAAEARASVQQSQGELSGAEIVLHQDTGDADATGNVSATSWARDGERTPGPATHVLASRARLLHAAGISEFFGEPERPAQLWQGGSQVRAALLTVDGKTKGVTARPAAAGGRVEAVFAQAEGRAGKGDSPGKTRPAATPGGRRGAGSLQQGSVPAAGRSAAEVSAERMDYDEERHQAVFTGAVQLHGTMGEASADRGVAFLSAPAPSGPALAAGKGIPSAGPGLSGTLERMVLLGDVRLTEPGRTGVGEQLTYTAATDSFVLTGTAAKPPRVTGEQGSLVTGATLLFRSGESTIVVAGAKRDAKATGPARVHTETDLRP